MATHTHTTATPGGEPPRTPSRRAWLAGAAALPALAVAGGISSAATPHHGGAGEPNALHGGICHAGSNPDAALIALCDAFQANRAAAALDFETWGDAMLCDTPPDVRAARRGLTDELHELREAIGATAATTMAGLVAKARMVLDDLAVGGAAPQYDPERVTPWSLAQDLLTLQGELA
jgi:hypothetical protein